VGAILLAFVPTLFLPDHAAAPVPAHAEEGAEDAGGADEGPRVAGAMQD
jgi:hypothetical protein